MKTDTPQALKDAISLTDDEILAELGLNPGLWAEVFIQDENGTYFCDTCSPMSIEGSQRAQRHRIDRAISNQGDYPFNARTATVITRYILT